MDVESIKSEFESLIKELEKKVPYAAALYNKSSGISINVNKVQEEIEPEDPVEGAVFTLWNGQSFFEYSTNEIHWPSLRAKLNDFADQCRAAIDPARSKTDIDPGKKLSKDFSGPLVKNPNSTPLPERLNMAREWRDAAIQKDPRVVNAMAVYGDRTHQDIFVNRHKSLSQKITRTDAFLMVFLSDKGNSSEMFKGLSKNGGLENTLISEEDITELVQGGIKLLEAERLPPGTYDVVTDPDWSGIIAHECFGHGMETDLYTRNRALSQHYIGQPIASPIVNMMDDPSLIDEAGGFFFDDEGQLATPTLIIKNGILMRGLTDLASAHKLKIDRSANGRRESYQRKAYARMTNTFFNNGDKTPEEIISSVKNGLYLRHATNGMEDPQAWGIQVEGLWAEEIKDGKLTGKVYSPVIMTGFVPDLLKSISMVGNDRYISGAGMCGKGHKEWIKNTTGGPHLKMRARLA